MSWNESWEAKQGPEITERITKSFKVGPNGSLDLCNVSGDIVVNEGGGDTIAVEAMKRTRGATPTQGPVRRVAGDDGRARGRVEVRTIYTATRTTRRSTTTSPRPPARRVYVHSVSGDVKVTNIQGDVRVDTVSGDVTAIDTPGRDAAEDGVGRRDVSGVSNGNELRVTRVSGDVTVNGAKVRAVDADSMSGNVHLTDVTCDRVTAKSISGDIDFGGAAGPGGRYELKSQSGNVRVTLASTPGFELDANSFSGNVRSDLPITVRAGASRSAAAARARRSAASTATAAPCSRSPASRGMW